MRSLLALHPKDGGTTRSKNWLPACPSGSHTGLWPYSHLCEVVPDGCSYRYSPHSDSVPLTTLSQTFPNIWLCSLSPHPTLQRLSAVCCSSFIPIYLTANWRVSSAFLIGHHHRVLSLLGCASAGVFLGAGLMHMTAEALEGIESEIQKFMVQVCSQEIQWQGYGTWMTDRS